MESIVVIGCPSCGRRYRFDTQRFGTSGVRVRCRSCETIMMVRVQPALLEEQPSEPAEEASIPVEPEVVEAPTTEDAPVPDAVELERAAAGVPAAEPDPAAQDAVQADTAEKRTEPDTADRVVRAAGNGNQTAGRALVADRDPDRRQLFSELLRQEGFTVSSVDGGFEARRIIAVERPKIAFLNAFLPEVLGVTLCAEIKRHPELSATNVVLIGSQYRRDRFVRDPGELYGADAFMDGSGDNEEILRQARRLLTRLSPPSTPEVRDDASGLPALKRLARIIAGDIILYNPTIAEAEIAAGRFFETFAEEIREGETLVARRFPEIGDRERVFHKTLQEAVVQHGVAAGIPSGGMARDH